MTASIDGEILDLEVGAIAHGGHCVARHEGRVVFVRHALPGERVRARVTSTGSGERFLRADAVEILRASPDRVVPSCPYAGECGGCDFQHIAGSAQRALKAQVVAEQFRRLAHEDVAVDVEPLPGGESGYRTRVEFAVGPAGRAGLHRHRSHEIVPVADCLLAAPRLDAAAVLAQSWTGASAVDVVGSSTGERAIVPVPDGEPGPVLHEEVTVRGRALTYAVAARGFWQVHRAAPAAFVEAVLDLVAVRPGETVLDLYAGVGLFARALAQESGPSGRVVAVEADRGAAALAEENLAGQRVVVVPARVDDAFGVPRPRRKGPDRGTRRRRLTRHPMLPPTADVVVLDPPRTGAGAPVLGAISALRPRAIGYVACDPAALARDTAYLKDSGYRLAGLRAFDAFPMTHHVECVALFTPAGNYG